MRGMLNCITERGCEEVQDDYGSNTVYEVLYSRSTVPGYIGTWALIECGRGTFVPL